MNQQQIILNSNNAVPNSRNCKYSYTFSQPMELKDKCIAVHSIQLYYSWYNISSLLYNNNTFQYKWFNNTNGLCDAIFTVNIPSGNYSFDDISLYLQAYMEAQGHYITETGGTKTFFIRFTVNPTFYACELTLSVMKTTLTTGQTKPSGWMMPTTMQTPVLIIPSTSKFGDLIGFKSGSYPSSIQSLTSVNLSNKVPVISPVTSLIVRSNVVFNKMMTPNNIICSLTQGNIKYGDIVNYQPNNLNFSAISNGTYNNVDIEFFDQNYSQALDIIDPDVLIILVIKDIEK